MEEIVETIQLGRLREHDTFEHETSHTSASTYAHDIDGLVSGDSQGCFRASLNAILPLDISKLRLKIGSLIHVDDAKHLSAVQVRYECSLWQ